MTSKVDINGRVIIEQDNLIYELEFNKYTKGEIDNANPLIFIRKYDDQFNLTQMIQYETQKKIIIRGWYPLKASDRNGRIQQKIQEQQTRPYSCEPTSDSWFIYTQNISRSDLEILYDNRRWIKSNIIDAMANKLNKEIYQKYFEEAKQLKYIKKKLQHVFPTTIFEEMERQFDLYHKGLKVVDCFQYQEELNFVKPIILELYSKFYFLINQGYHFFLVELDLSQKILSLYDPLYYRSHYFLQKIKCIIQKIISKYDIYIDLKIQQLIPYPRQQDGVNCGIYTLYYLNELIQDKCLTNPSSHQIDPLYERQTLKLMLMKPNPKIKIQQTNYFVSSQTKY
ncbi:hypothetical protein pb186bvf_017164 [Paramecium bursaria]